MRITRAPRARLIFITSFPLGNSKHILITFFTGRSTSTPQKRAAAERSFGLSSLLAFFHDGIFCLTSDLPPFLSLPPLFLSLPFLERRPQVSPTLSRSRLYFSRKSATEHPTFPKSRVMRDESKTPARRAPGNAISRRERPRRSYALAKAILRLPRSSPCPLSPFLRPGTVKGVPRARRLCDSFEPASS